MVGSYAMGILIATAYGRLVKDMPRIALLELR